MIRIRLLIGLLGSLPCIIGSVLGGKKGGGGKTWQPLSCAIIDFPITFWAREIAAAGVRDQRSAALGEICDNVCRSSADQLHERYWLLRRGGFIFFLLVFRWSIVGKCIGSVMGGSGPMPALPLGLVDEWVMMQKSVEKKGRDYSDEAES